MDLTLSPKKITGTVSVVPSKSQAHRLLICAAFADGPTDILCSETNSDMEATADCLRSLGAEIASTEMGFHVTPVSKIPPKANLFCRDSGSTLRFLLPVVAALGVDATFHMTGRLADRPLSPLWEAMEAHGCHLSRPTDDTLRCTGIMEPGAYAIDGSVSSQFISGLLFAAALMEGTSTVAVTGQAESRPYIAMTRQAMALFGRNTENMTVKGGIPYHSPGTVTVEGDWSSGAFFLAAKALGSPMDVTGLDPKSTQGDRIVAQLLPALRRFQTVSARDIPDLVPVLAVVAAANQGAVFTDIRRLRLKESDRVESTVNLIRSLGGKAHATENTLTVEGTGLFGGTVDPRNDHRIAMAAAIAATVCTSPVTILGAECVRKSDPDFWNKYTGGSYEQYIRR